MVISKCPFCGESFKDRVSQVAVSSLTRHLTDCHKDQTINLLWEKYKNEIEKIFISNNIITILAVQNSIHVEE